MPAGRVRPAGISVPCRHKWALLANYVYRPELIYAKLEANDKARQKWLESRLESSTPGTKNVQKLKLLRFQIRFLI